MKQSLLYLNSHNPFFFWNKFYRNDYFIPLTLILQFNISDSPMNQHTPLKSVGLSGFISPCKHFDCRVGSGGCKLLITDISLTPISVFHCVWTLWLMGQLVLLLKWLPRMTKISLWMVSASALTWTCKEAWETFAFHCYFRDCINLNEFIFICGSEYQIMVNITEHNSALNSLSICEYFLKVLFTNPSAWKCSILRVALFYNSELNSL